jgi:DNA-binding GntR family transcriptional regulator
MTDALTEQTIGEWEKGGPMKRMAADLARKINAGIIDPWTELPPNAALADEWDISERTARKAKQLLADHGLLHKENGHYYVK